jgi:hypothetical protein
MKLKLPDSEIMRIPYNRMKKKMEFLAQYNKAFEDAIKEGTGKMKGKH